MVRESVGRCFKTRWFDRAARAAGIVDLNLLVAAREAWLGLAVDLGWRCLQEADQSQSSPSHRPGSAGAQPHFVYLYSKQDRANIALDELVGFRDLANAYAGLTDAELQAVIASGELVELNDGQQDQIQKRCL